MACLQSCLMMRHRYFIRTKAVSINTQNISTCYQNTILLKVYYEKTTISKSTFITTTMKEMFLNWKWARLNTGPILSQINIYLSKLLGSLHILVFDLLLFVLSVAVIWRVQFQSPRCLNSRLRQRSEFVPIVRFGSYDPFRHLGVL